MCLHLCCRHLAGSQAAASGLCPDQCILKANGNNVMSDGAPEVPEHLQAFRSHWEEALGPYQWAYQTHKDVQEAWEAHREDPNDEGAGEEDQPNSDSQAPNSESFLAVLFLLCPTTSAPAAHLVSCAIPT
nr:phosphatidylinositol 3,4,5-trisphosphate-dependent Rac exchanger 1 protein-like [Camelus dromedarius]